MRARRASRWRLSLASSEPQYDELDRRLANTPAITVSALTIASDFDGPAKNGASYRKLFTDRYSHPVLDGVGHNVPQEAPQDYANATVEVDSY